MPTNKDAAAQLAEQLIRALEQQRSRGPNDYPLPLRRLADIAAPGTPSAQVLKAAGKKSFRAGAAVLRSRTLDSPVALAADSELMAGSDLALGFVLGLMRTPANQAFSVAQLKKKVAQKLQKTFQTAVSRRLEEGSLSAAIGWITMQRTKRLFLLSDLRTGGQPSTAAAPPTPDRAALQPAPATAATPGPAASPPLPAAHEPPRTIEALPANVEAAFDAAFRRLDRQAGLHNFVSLVDLRQAVPLPREVFDAEIHRLRLAGRYSLSAAEGRHGTSPLEREAGIMEDGTLLLYVSLKSP